MDKSGIKQTNIDLVKSFLQSTNFWRIVLINLGFLFFIIYWYKEEWNLFLVLTTIFLSSLYKLAPDYYREILFFTFLFPIVEVVCIVFGIFQYSMTSVLVIPIWLFPAWGQVVSTIIWLHNGVQDRLYKDKM